MQGNSSVRTFRDELNREWEVRAVHETLTERRIRLLPRPELAQGWLLFRAGDERRRLAPLPPLWFVATESQLTRWWDDADRVPRASPMTERSPEGARA